MLTSKSQITLSEATLLRSQSHEPTASTYRYHSQTDAVQIQRECGEDDLNTPTLLSSAVPQSSPRYSGSEVLSSRAGNYIADTTDDYMIVRSNNPLAVSLRHSRYRSPPFNSVATEESSLPFLQSPVGSGQTSIPRDDASSTGDSAVYLNTPSTSSHPSVSSISPSRTPEKSNSALEASAYENHELLSDSAFDIIKTGYHVSTSSLPGNRPYTASLGIPSHWERGQVSGLSVVSDAGDQQHKRQKKKTSEIEAHTSQASVADEQQQRIYDQVEQFPNELSCYQLQSEIFDALVPTRNPQVMQPSYGFLPKAHLYRLVDENSVFRELTKDLPRASPMHTLHKNRQYAASVCTETEVEHDGKLKIKSFRKIFAVLVLAEMSSSISKFLDEDVSDLDLPLFRNGATMARRHQDASETRNKALTCFGCGPWSPTKLRNFETFQWTMLAPFFSQGECGDVKHYPLQDQHILPFVSPKKAEDDAIEHLGGYGKVFMVRIHEEHRNFQDPQLCERGFAIKQLYESNPRAFKKEVNILKKFSGDRSHPHVVSLLATYEQFKKYHLVFYRAEGDLFKLWKELIPNPVLNYNSIKWMAKQCAGVAEGLLKLHKHLTFGVLSHIDTEEDTTHNSIGIRHVRMATSTPPLQRMDREDNEVPSSPSWAPVVRQQIDHVAQIEQYGRHGDINPGNLLWYDEPYKDIWTLRGTLKISDFGQAELNSQFSRSGKRSVANTMTYRPPECDLQPKIIRQSYDIWCLGCVYLEFVTWILGGERLLIQFVKQRTTRDVFQNNHKTDTFFQLVRGPDSEHAEVMIKPAVTKVSGAYYNEALGILT